jgi:hypothetical protein
MDALYVFKHSPYNDFEIRYSLRSIERYAPYIRKVWIFGDRPAFLSDNKSLVECVPHKSLAPILGVTTPVTNFFLMLFLSSLIPDLSYEYLWFCDDFFLMADFPIEEARKDRYLGDMSVAHSQPQFKRPRGLWRDCLWRTYELLKRLGYSGYNFEPHVPTYLTKKRVLEAYRDLRDYVTEDRWFGMLGPTAILNHANSFERLDLVSIKDQGSRFGFWGSPPSYEEIVSVRHGKSFFNFDDNAFGPGIARFLCEMFPHRSRYESDGDWPSWPEVVDHLTM